MKEVYIMEVQAHGNLFEDHIIRKIAGVSKLEYEKLIPNAYTSPMDIHAGVKSDKSYSIKASKGKGIGLGDMLSFYKELHSGEFIMVVGLWEQLTASEKSFHTVYEFKINRDYAKILFGGVTESDIVEFRNWISNIPKGKDAQQLNSSIWKTKRDQLEKQNLPVIKFCPKIDSNKQRRLQAGTHIDDLINAGIPFTKYTKEYVGIPLPLKIAGSKRKFNK